MHSFNLFLDRQCLWFLDMQYSSNPSSQTAEPGQYSAEGEYFERCPLYDKKNLHCKNITSCKKIAAKSIADNRQFIEQRCLITVKPSLESGDSASHKNHLAMREYTYIGTKST